MSGIRPRTKGHFVICNLGDVVVVPFPFVDVTAERRRPCVIISHSAFNEATRHSVCAMITTASRPPWAGDVAIGDLITAGLHVPCVIRWKVFTLPNENIVRRLGILAVSDHLALVEALNKVALD
jgi:mRNA interferase MazF